MSETPYAETEMLLAHMNEDNDRLTELLDDFSVSELSAFLDQLITLRAVVQDTYEIKVGRERYERS